MRYNKHMDSNLKWIEYQERTANGNPRQLLVEAISHTKKKDAALDIGAGALNDVQYLLNQGFRKVIAVDQTPQFRQVSVPLSAHFVYNQKQFGEYEFPIGCFDLISAQFSLPFASKNQFGKIWTGIQNALKPNGIFVGQFFGVRDDWHGRMNILFHEKGEVDRLICKFDVIKREEQEYTENSSRKKHWHYFNLILRK